jgi:hypothetical protein
MPIFFEMYDGRFGTFTMLVAARSRMPVSTIVSQKSLGQRATYLQCAQLPSLLDLSAPNWHECLDHLFLEGFEPGFSHFRMFEQRN